MRRATVTAESFGHDVLGPMVAEFLLRLWSLASLLERPDDAALLFCARGGLRLHLAYERFLAASGLPAPVPAAPFMVSRLVAVRAVLLRTVDEDRSTLLPSAAVPLTDEFPGRPLSEVAVAMSGVQPSGESGDWNAPFSPDGFAALLRHPDGKAVVDALREQAGFFDRHVRESAGGRPRVLLVDTGLYGTTARLMADGVPDVDAHAVLIARSHRTGVVDDGVRSVGLSVDSRDYSPFRRRTALLRYWQFVEWICEPELPSVRTFAEEGGVLRSNLEVDGWQDRVRPDPGSPFAGVLSYLDALPHGPAQTVLRDADAAWSAFRRAVVWPAPGHGTALVTGPRSHDFGRDGTWSAPPERRALAALRGTSDWREGEIARSGSPLRLPLLTAIEAAYGARLAARTLARRGILPGRPAHPSP
jgi:hypothetical protein